MKPSLILIAALLLFDAGTNALANESGAYTSRADLVELVRKGDVDARWDLAWGYSKEGKYQKAYDWARDAGGAAGNNDRSYLRAWLARQLGNMTASNNHILMDLCDSEPCLKLRAGNFSAMGRDADAASAFVSLWDKYSNASTFVSACASLIAIRDWAAFDEMISRVDWANDPAYKPSIPAILNLRKIRVNFK